MSSPVLAQAKQINLAGASYDMREAILGEFRKRTGITLRPFVILFLKEKKEGHFRVMWKAYGELVNPMASEEVWIANA